MSHTYPMSKRRERTLNATIFEYITGLEGLDGVQETENDKTQFQKFVKDLKSLAKCKSFYTGNEDDEYATVLHKVLTVYKLKEMGKLGAEECAQKCDDALAEGYTQSHPTDCTQKSNSYQECVLSHIIENYPQLIHCQRDQSRNFCGQTPLHMAISKGYKQLVEKLLIAAKWCNRPDAGDVKELLSQKATGLRFKNNIMMGELPLSIAVLTFNTQIVKLLLKQKETEVCQQNSVGDNLFHSLLRYVYIFPDKANAAIEMMKFIKKEKKDCYTKLALMPNFNKETPIILAAKHGLVEIVQHIIEEGYCETDDSSGLFDVKLYDVTDIDNQLKEYRKQEEKKVLEVYFKASEHSEQKTPKPEEDIGGPPVFDLIFHHSYKTSLRFMQIRPIKWMIMNKWRHYRKFLYSLFLFHLIVMSVLTAAAVERVKSQRTVTINDGLGDPFPAYFSIIMAIVSLLYIWFGVFKIVLICRRKFQATLKPFLNPYANAIFHALFFLFGVCIICDFGATWSTDYNNMYLIAGVVIGWYLLLFFLRANSFFCFFTSLIQRILLQDITRFAPIIALQLVAFSTAMFMLLQSPKNPNTEGYSNWGEMLLLTFKSFLGVGDIPISDSDHPVWLAIVFVVFIIMTTILMLNALIAILSSTCTELLNHFTPDMHLRLQQLAIILFFEGLLPNSVTHYFAKKVTREVDVYMYDTLSKHKRLKKRHLMRIDVFEDDDVIDGASETPFLSKVVKEVIEKYAGNNTKPQPPLNKQTNRMLKLRRSTIRTINIAANAVGHQDTNNTMAKTDSHPDLNRTTAGTVDHQDSKRHLDVYIHPQVQQTQTV
ncbi:hypothetical protein CHS0354_018987 [Potamilus streckersoni]|uniref:Ion transport domain-containing protein n=1 Tax=Potamilus streckersoni TaxID=2493646 RepID=A0AAE0SLY5_9BIVA|nr:hypothetical protein CHS0354_018987 [Potamilus streckersoni]